MGGIINMLATEINQGGQNQGLSILTGLRFKKKTFQQNNFFEWRMCEINIH